MRPEMGRMQCFVASLLTQHGALVEPVEPEGLEVLAPLPVQQALGLNELSRLGFSATLPDGAERVGIESDWLDRCGQSIGERGRYMRLVLRSEAPAPSDPQRVLEHALVLDNASIRLVDVVPGWTRYFAAERKLQELMSARPPAGASEREDELYKEFLDWKDHRQGAR